ncbi:TatD family hydrolase [Pseudomonas matsuisoli]|uniref:TatD-related deoxyribonuclease n=1 Tax=Pseudomonas matsuisoli TaxID=1515666 RepID=A0A917PXF5_9PSED|nr:TatD family hydrolase [Pseudomonas matsuisoli]GGJ96890.1 TatD-related deoxyribonuclease [Pseudomonas matsuisoli]
MQLIDTHNHLDFPPFDSDRQQVIDSAIARGVERQVVIGVYHDHWERLWSLATAQPSLFATLGLHPVFMHMHTPEHLQRLRQWLERLQGHPKLCAIGEVGLDYYVERPDKDAQKTLFEAQIELAIEFDLPLLLHVRRAHADVTAILKRYRPPRGGIAHAFSGSYEEACEYLRLGFKIGLGGAGTWPQAKRMHRVLKQLPLDGIVLETDAPDITPASHAGERNSPVFLPDICHTLAELKGVPAEELADAATRNTEALFGWESELNRPE